MLGMSSKKYAAVGFAMILVMILFLSFSEGTDEQVYDRTGIVHNVRSSSNGYTFYLDTVDGSIRCYFDESPIDMGYYGVGGSFSDDGSIFFVRTMACLEPNSSSCIQHHTCLPYASGIPMDLGITEDNIF